MMRSLFWVRCMVLFIGSGLAMIAGAQEQDSNSTSTTESCNICGEDNLIQFPTAVIEFTYHNKTYRNNCQTWQHIVKNSNAISGEFCSYALNNHDAAKVCGCVTPEGDFVADIIKQQQQQNTVAPSTTPGSARLPSDAAPMTDVGKDMQEELQAASFTVNYGGITSDPDNQDFGEVQDTTCKHVRDTITDLLGRLVSFQCNATFYGRDMAVYDFGATVASLSNTAKYSQEELDNAIDQAFSDRFRVNELLSEIKSLPDENPFSSTTVVAATISPLQSSTVLTKEVTTANETSASCNYIMVSREFWCIMFLLLLGVWQSQC